MVTNKTPILILALAGMSGFPACYTGINDETDLVDGLLHIPGHEPRLVTVERVEGRFVLEGDIVLHPRMFEPEGAEVTPDKANLAVGIDAWLWPDGIIPYVIDPALPNQGRVHAAIAHWEQHTPIDFVPYSGQTDFVRFEPDANPGSCWSYIGRIGGQQPVRLGNNCTTGTAIHEIGHVVGAWHEQSRTDRDHHVIILWNNIIPGLEYAFERYLDAGYPGKDVGPYDISSIMHYGPYAFSKNNQPTIVRKSDGQPYVANYDVLSAGDISAVKQVYGGPYYCPNASVTRAQMATFLLKTKYGGNYVPPPATGKFLDVNPNSVHAPFIEQLANEGITQGCAEPGHYCPSNPVNRAQMATFLLRSKNGGNYVAPAATGMFLDVNPNSVHAPFIEQLANEGITNGCAKAGHYCPNETVTRAQMATLLLKTKYGGNYSPPAASGVFDDVPPNSTHAAFIEQLFAEGITSGCVP